MPKENDLQGQQDQGGKHGDQKGMPRPEPRPGASKDQGIVRDKRGQEQPCALSKSADKAAIRPGASSRLFYFQGTNTHVSTAAPAVDLRNIKGKRSKLYPGNSPCYRPAPSQEAGAAGAV